MNFIWPGFPCYKSSQYLIVSLWWKMQWSPQHIFVIQIPKDKFCPESNLNSFLTFCTGDSKFSRILIRNRMKTKRRVQILELGNVLRFFLTCSASYMALCFKNTCFALKICLHVHKQGIFLFCICLLNQSSRAVFKNCICCNVFIHIHQCKTSFT